MIRLIVVGVVMGMVALAQTDRGTLTGVISDPAGAIVANAAIELRGVETGTMYQAATSATGNYTFSQLPVGTYELTVAIPGFKKLTRSNIRVQSSQVIPLNIVLEVGSASESVTVTAEVTLLRTDSSDVSANVETDRLTSLPILPIGNGNSSSHGVRTPQAVANLIPGTYFAPSSNIRVNGSPSNTEAVRVEGQDATVNVAGRTFNPTHSLASTLWRKLPSSHRTTQPSTARPVRECSATPSNRVRTNSTARPTITSRTNS